MASLVAGAAGGGGVGTDLVGVAPVSLGAQAMMLEAVASLSASRREIA
jgi:hypothetical protein